MHAIFAGWHAFFFESDRFPNLLMHDLIRHLSSDPLWQTSYPYCPKERGA
jgi:hypothetical protein